MSEHRPFIAANANVREFGLVPVLMGAVLGIVFGASSLYLALKVGLTVSASIPVAVLSITVFRWLSKFGVPRATILENNIVQTTGSAGESIAFGVAITMPALLILGYEMELSRTMLVAILGGLLGVLMMIPLRHALIVKEHGKLAYPEGTACAEVLIVGEKGGTSAKTVFMGFFIGAIHKVLNVGNKLWNDTPSKAISWFKGATVSGELTPELLGVGYIIGPKTASIIMAGGVLAAWVLTPMITLFGSTIAEPIYPGTTLISKMSYHEIRNTYILYIGAGAVATGGLISMAQSLPTIASSLAAGLKSLTKNGAKSKDGVRTERDLPMSFVTLGSMALILMIWLAPNLHINLLGAVLIVLFGFLFVTVSSRLTGEIGSSSNPISGITVATLLLTSLIFLGLGWTTLNYRVTALSVAAIVCIAASNAGTTSQDLKTGYLVGATPRYQQLGLLVGALTSALVIGFTLIWLNESYTVYSKKKAPQDITIPNVASLVDRGHVTNGEYSSDTKEYRVLRVSEANRSGALAKLAVGKYLVDDAGKIQYFVDPAINGTLEARDNGEKIMRFDAPKARLMSLIIDGILTQKLPWGLVVIGACIALVLELCGIASLPFAVGVYLPFSTSSPIFVGGALRWWVDRKSKVKNADAGDSSPGVLLSSGLIAGGAIAAILCVGIQLIEPLKKFMDLESWTAGAAADILSVIAFAAMGIFLVLVGKGTILKQKRG